MVPEFESLGITSLCKEKFNDMVQYVVAAPDISEEERKEFHATMATMPKEDLSMFHMTLGKHLRNKFGLWSFGWTTEVDTRTCCDMSKNHPDSISMAVIEQAQLVIKDKMEKGELNA